MPPKRTRELRLKDDLSFTPKLSSDNYKPIEQIIDRKVDENKILRKGDENKQVESKSHEYKRVECYLRSMDQLEDGMSYEEMKDLADCLNNSLQDGGNCSKNFTKIVIEEISPDSRKKAAQIAEDQNHILQYYKPDIEENWDQIDYAVTPGIGIDEKPINYYNRVLVEVDVHHEFDWDPEEDLRKKLENIELNESRKAAWNPRRRSNDKFWTQQQQIKEPDTAKGKILKRKRKNSFGEPWPIY